MFRGNLLIAAVIVITAVCLLHCGGEIDDVADTTEIELSDLPNYPHKKIHIVGLHLQGKTWDEIGMVLDLPPHVVRRIYKRKDKWAFDAYGDMQIKRHMAMVYAETVAREAAFAYIQAGGTR